MGKRTLAILLSAVMAASVWAPSAFAQEESAVLDGEKVSGISQEELDRDSVMGSDIRENEDESADSSGGIMLFASSANAWKKKSEGVYYDGTGVTTLKGAVAKGIDVSSWQGTINWQKAKADGVEFAIIRLGYGSNYTSQDDSKLEYNVEQCEKYGIPYGFYLYSYADTLSKNTSEINHVKRLIAGKNPTYPVYYDLEDSGTTGKKTNAEIQQYALNFCKAISEAGYTPGVYASLSWWKNKLDTSKLDSYERWVAQWNNSGCTYTRSWKLWQCADDYNISGISGNVDLDFAYKKFTADSSSDNSALGGNDSGNSGAEIVTGWVTKNGKKYYYNSSGVLQKSKWITSGGKKYYATSTGAIYMNTYKKIGNYYYGFDSSGAMYAGKTATIGGKKYYFAANGRAYLYKAKTKVRLNYRTGPGTKYKRVGTYSKGKAVTVLRRSGNWRQLTTGYWVHKSYLKVTKTYPY